MGDAKPEEKLPFMEPTPEMEAMMKKMNYGLIKVRPPKKNSFSRCPFRSVIGCRLCPSVRACPALCVRGGGRFPLLTVTVLLFVQHSTNVRSGGVNSNAT